MELPKEVQKQRKEMEAKTINLAGLAQAFEDEDKRSVYLLDNTGNAQIFFKYKARMIDMPTTIMEVNTKMRSKEDAIEGIRKHLTYGIKQGEVVVFHVGEMNMDVDEFLKGQKFWNPKELFKPPGKMDGDWYRANVMKPTDKDPFGGEGTLYPSDSFIMYVSLTKDIPFDKVSWLDGTAQNFKAITIN